MNSISSLIDKYKDTSGNILVSISNIDEFRRIAMM